MNRASGAWRAFWMSSERSTVARLMIAPSAELKMRTKLTRSQRRCVDLVPVARHQAAAHALRLDDHAVDRAVVILGRDGSTSDGIREGPPPASDTGPSPCRVAVTDLAKHRIDPLPAVSTTPRCACAIHQPISGLARKRELRTGNRTAPATGGIGRAYA